MNSLNEMIANALNEFCFVDAESPLEKAKADAVIDGIDRVALYKNHGFLESFIEAAFVKRICYIREASTVAEIKDIQKAPHPTFNGNEIVIQRYPLDEEECMCWSLASLKAPLNEYAFKRYMFLFEKTTGVSVDEL